MHMKYVWVFISLALTWTSWALLPARLRTRPASSSRRHIQADHKDNIGFFDEARIFVKGGSGGQGSTSFKYGKNRQHIYPTGGNGGDGGDVYFFVDPNLNTLEKFKNTRSFKAEMGEGGKPYYKNGGRGQDVYVGVPLYTHISFDQTTVSNQTQNHTTISIATLSEKHQRLLVVRGGRGGRGNGAKGRAGEPLAPTSPQGGQSLSLHLSLELLADVGLIGAPNAGKSTLLGKMSGATPKIANYPFTTLVPNLGVCYLNKYRGVVKDEGYQHDSLVLADIPGVIEDAHVGRGLGFYFLKHIQRCAIYIHVVDIHASDYLKTYKTVCNELIQYDVALSRKPQIVVLTKADKLSQLQMKERVRDICSHIPHSRVLVMGGHGDGSDGVATDGVATDGDADGVHVTSVGELVGKLFSFYNKIKEQERKDEQVCLSLMPMLTYCATFPKFPCIFIG